MAWSTPSTQTTGTLITSTLWNEIVNDVIYLNARPDDSYVLDEGSDYTTTSTSFVVVDATNLSIAVASNGGDILIGFTGSAYNTAAGGLVEFDLYVDIDGGGYNAVGTDDGIVSLISSSASNPVPLGLFYMYTGTSSGSTYTFRLYWKVGSGTGTLPAGGGTFDSHAQFWAREV